ncbi:unnamed protein product [Orchesella dallaii]|uniref:Uncharacterized protein n=1 Tax=Orchesella dallaii TaxID=48710 RepID=A0ABP1QID7_9HEXA
MARFFVLFVFTFLYIWNGKILGVTAYHGKADLFLTSDAIPGFGGEPEDFMPSGSIDYSISADDFVAPLTRAMVLGGNYPEDSLEIPEEGGGGGGGEDSSDGDSNAPPLRKFLTSVFLDPIHKILFPNGKSMNSSSSGGMAGRSMDGGDGTSKTYAEQLLACQRKLFLCSLTRIYNVQCYTHCLLQANPAGAQISTVVNDVVKQLCNPIGTITEKGGKQMKKNLKSIKSVPHFVNMYKMPSSKMKRFARVSANALPNTLIRYGHSNSTRKLKSLISSLETAVKKVNKGTVFVNTLNNRNCPFINPAETVEDFVAASFQDPSVLDLALAGHWTFSSIHHKLPRAMQDMSNSFLGSMEILTGINCGVVYSSETGKKQKCEKRVNWQKDKSYPAEIAKPVVCGVVPYFPADIYDEEFPSVFDPQEMTTEEPTEEKERKEMEEGMKGRAADGDNKDKEWVEDVMKTFDMEDNV